MLMHKGTVTLKTPRLTLRRLTLDDAHEMYDNWATDKKMTEYLLWEPYTDIEDFKEFIKKCTDDYNNPGFYFWGISFEGKIVGTISLNNIADRQERCELGYSIGSKWWNMGIATEAVKEVIRFAFEEVGLNKVCGLYDVDNTASGRVMQKNGMIQEGLLRQHTIHKDGSRGDLSYYAILKTDWRKNHATKHRLYPSDF